MRIRILFFVAVSWMFCSQGIAQQTIGLFINKQGAYDGYTLFGPQASTDTYLIDNCGRQIHSWPSEFKSTGSVYFLENGNLIKNCPVNTSTFGGVGGIGGRVEMYNWEGEVVWGYDYNSDRFHSHHDIEYLPNGNVLLIAWDLHTAEEAIEAGRDPSTIGDVIWSSKIVELEPVGADDANIVWEWKLWDHLVQDFDPTLANSGIVADHPELVDLNFDGNANINRDWQHCNAIDYNEVLDQIIISSRNNQEFWILDHSTTTEEAAGHTGGNAGKGGDILYRWGNPMAYGRGTEADKKFHYQHDCQWIAEGLPDAGKIMVFNNGLGRPGGNYSTVEILEPAIENDGSYIIEDNAAYGPEDAYYTYTSDPPNSFYAQFVSGVSQLPNGNFLICEGQGGRLFEIDSDEGIVWEYQNPVAFDPVEQGTITDNSFYNIFRAYRYSFDYPGFDGRDLSPGDPIELNPLPIDCVPTSTTDIVDRGELALYPNPTSDHLYISIKEMNIDGVEIYSTNGQIIQTYTLTDIKASSIDVSFLDKGLFILKAFNKDKSEQVLTKFIKL